MLKKGKLNLFTFVSLVASKALSFMGAGNTSLAFDEPVFLNADNFPHKTFHKKTDLGDYLNAGFLVENECVNTEGLNEWNEEMVSIDISNCDSIFIPPGEDVLFASNIYEGGNGIVFDR